MLIVLPEIYSGARIRAENDSRQEAGRFIRCFLRRGIILVVRGSGVATAGVAIGGATNMAAPDVTFDVYIDSDSRAFYR